MQLVYERLWKPRAERAGIPKINREGLGDAYDAIPNDLFAGYLTTLASNAWHSLRLWIRLVLAKEGLQGKALTTAVARVEDVILDRTRHMLELEGKARSDVRAEVAAAATRAAGAPAGAAAGAAAGPGAGRKRRARGGVAHARPTTVTPALERHVLAAAAGTAGPPPAPLLSRDLVGEFEAAMQSYGIRRPADVTPTPGLPIKAPTEAFTALPKATREAVDALGHRLFAALPYPYTREGTDQAPMRYSAVLQVLREHREAYRSFAVRTANGH